MAGIRPLIDWVNSLFGSEDAGRVSSKSMLTNAPFWYGINKISGNLGTLPLNLMYHKGRDRKKAVDHSAYQLLKLRPNELQTPVVFKQSLTKDVICWGNGRAYIDRSSSGLPLSLIPLQPDRTFTTLIEGKKWHYSYPEFDNSFCSSVDNLLSQMKKNPNGVVMMPDKDVLHIQGFGNGLCGYSLFEYARQSLQISLGADKRSARQMQKGFAGKVMLEAPENMFREEGKAKEFLEDYVKKHGTDGEGQEVGLLIEGIKANVLQMSNRDAEFIEQRKFQRQEAALWLMLESILGDDESVSYNSEEQKQLAYLKHCLDTYLVRWEQECAKKLLTEKEFLSEQYYFKFNVASLLRTDFPTTISTLKSGIEARIWNPNEAREKVDENPYEGGDEYGNPAITPGSPGGGDDGGSDSNSVDTSAMQARLKHMIGIEEKRVSRFLNRGDSFDHIDQWYESWVDRLAVVIEDFGGDWEIAQSHCVRSLKYLKNNPDAKKLDLANSEELIIEEIQNEKV